jgi:hypothetical protein
VETARLLQARIKERFPDASLGQLAARVVGVAEDSARQAAALRKPNLPVRIGTILLIAAKLTWKIDISDLGEFVPLVQAGLESVIFLGAGIAFLVTLETGLKRARAQRAVHELRVPAHLVDMHQLDKDPVYVLADGPATKSSPKRTMTAFELNRYLDYCCELLSLIGKLAALYGQNLDDPQAMSAVDGIEDLTTGLARKIWQKTMLLRNS